MAGNADSLTIRRIRNFGGCARCEAALVEYGMLVGLIAVICVVAVTTLGTEGSSAFSKIASALAGL